MDQNTQPAITFGPMPTPNAAATEPTAPEEREETHRGPNVAELASAYALALEFIEADAESMTDEVFNDLAENETALHAKLANYGAAIKIHKAEAATFRALKEPLQAILAELEHKAKMVENQADRKRSRLHQVMAFFGIQKVKNSHASVFTKKNPPAVEVVNETLALSALPEDYIRTKREVLKSTLLAAIKADPESPDWEGWGVGLKPPSNSLTIR